MIIPQAFPYYFPGQQPPPGPEIDATRNVEYPDIISWCHYLDAHNGRNRDGVQFVPYGEILKDKGFFRLSLLNEDYFSVQDLAGWLGLGDRIGIALLIMQHAKNRY
jgi:hypothetical protein